MSNLFGLGPRVRHGYGVWFDMIMAKAKPGWSGPGQVLVRVLVRHGYDKSQTGVVRSWSGPGSNLLRSLFEPGLGFEPGSGFGSTRSEQNPNRGGKVLTRSWFEPG